MFKEEILKLSQEPFQTVTITGHGGDIRLTMSMIDKLPVRGRIGITKQATELVEGNITYNDFVTLAMVDGENRIIEYSVSAVDVANFIRDNYTPRLLNAQGEDVTEVEDVKA